MYIYWKEARWCWRRSLFRCFRFLPFLNSISIDWELARAPDAAGCSPAPWRSCRSAGGSPSCPWEASAGHAWRRSCHQRMARCPRRPGRKEKMMKRRGLYIPITISFTYIIYIYHYMHTRHDILIIIVVSTDIIYIIYLWYYIYYISIIYIYINTLCTLTSTYNSNTHTHTHATIRNSWDAPFSELDESQGLLVHGAAIAC